METAASVLPARAERSSLPERSDRSLTRREPPASFDEIAEAVLKVELLKQIRPALTDQQRTALVVEIQAERWTNAELQQRARSVAAKETYGTIALHHWLDGILMTPADARRMAERILADRRRTLIEAGAAEEELERQGLVDIQDVYRRKLDDLRHRVGQTLEARVRKASAFIRQADYETKLEIKEIVNSKGILRAPLDDDPLWSRILHYFAPHILPEIELMMNRRPA